MTSTFTANLGIEKPATGDRSGTWGTMTNTNMDIIDRAIAGVGAITLSGTTHTLTTTDGSLTDGQFRVLVLGGSPSGTNTITISPNDMDKLYFVVNNSGQSVIFTQGSGSNVTILNGGADIIYADGGGSGAAVASFLANDITFGDDVSLKSDGAVLSFGSDNDTTLTHTDGTGLTLNSTNKITFGDVASFIQQSSDGVLRLDGEATIDLNASTAVTVSNDLKLDSDSSVLSFGSDSDVTFTHVADSGVTMAVTGNNIPIFKISEDRNDSSGGPQVILTREYASTTPADDDQGGTIIFQMENDNDETNTMCQISTINADVTDGSEKGEFQFYVKDGSSFPNILKIGVGNSNVREVLPGADSAAILGTDSNYSNTGSGVLKWLRVHADRLVSGTGTTFSASGTAVALGLASGESGIAVRTGETTMSPMTFEVGSSTVGSISCTSDATSYNTTSDYRLKENIVDMSGAMDRIKELKPKRFNFKTNTDKTVDGFLAHEAQKVVPEAVTGEKDGLLNGQILAQSIDQSKLIPLLTGALQEALAEIDALKVRVAFLEEK